MRRGCGAGGLAAAAARARASRPRVCLPLVAFPLGWQFFGPQSYTSVLHGDNAGNSPLAFLEFAGRSLAGRPTSGADPLALNRTEQNAFYGWPLIALAAAIVVRLWRRALVKALAFTAVAAAFLSLGPEVPHPVHGHRAARPVARCSPHQPLFESVIECAGGDDLRPGAGHAARARRGPAGGRRATACTRWWASRRWRLALLPVLPTPYPVRERAEVPAFITDGHCTARTSREGESLVHGAAAAIPAARRPCTGRSATGLGFRVAGGYFNGPWGPDRDRHLRRDAPPHLQPAAATSATAGAVPVIGAELAGAGAEDLAAGRRAWWCWRPQYNDEAAVCDAWRNCSGEPGKRVGGVWVWDVQDGPKTGRTGG